MNKLIAITVALVATGCFSTTNYHTAETLPKGESSLGFGWGVTTIQKMEAKSEDGAVSSSDGDDLPSLPNIIPDISLRFGLSDNTEWGAKIYLIGTQLDYKWRFVHTGGLSIAIDPTVGYGRPFMVLEEFSIALPLQIAYRVNKSFAFYAAGKGFYGNWRFPFVDSMGKDIDERLGTLGWGATAGIDFGIGDWFVRPEFNFTSQKLFGDGDGELNFDFSSVGLAFGFKFGGDKKKIEALNKRVDKLEGK